MKNIRRFRWASILVPALALGLSGCGGNSLFNAKLFQERAADTPAPSEQVIPKSFFVDPSGKPKEFLCAVAPELGQGDIGQQQALPFTESSPGHCNIEFEITKDFLIGRLVNPSFLNDQSRWVTAVKIPITKHFYYEQAKDEHGRNTNQWIENDHRSHWSARPMMKLDLAGIQWPGAALGDTMLSMHPFNVHDIEWDYKQNFLGFSVDTQFSPDLLGGATTDQVTYRVNFLAFQHNPNFKRTPYNELDSNYMNILHVFGRKYEGVEQQLYAGHWDLSRPHRIYISGAPAGVIQDSIVAAIDEWNATLQKIGAVRPGVREFVPIIANLKHPFDLRYPSITWVSDRRIAPYMPLGVGMAHADVRNGEILSGSIVLFGGILEQYIDSYTPLASGSGGATSMLGGLNPLYAVTKDFATHFNVIQNFDRIDQSERSGYVQNFMNNETLMTEKIANLIQKRTPTKDVQKQIATLRQELEADRKLNPVMNQITATAIQQAQSEANSVNQYFSTTSMQNLFGLQNMNKSKVLNAQLQALKTKNPVLAKILSENNLGKRQQMLGGLVAQNQTKAGWNDADMTAENLVGGWKSAEQQTNQTYPDMLRSVALNLTLHEFGHLLGLGHQFKENIIPKAGTVPSKYIAELKREEKNNFTNYTSVMGYMSGRTEMHLKASDLKPGPDDELVLRYLYNDQFSLYDRAHDKFAFAQVPPNGLIPAHADVDGRSMNTSYFPQCNDVDASYGADPYCNRWDTGSQAVDIVKSYFQELSDNLLANLYSLVGGGGYQDYAEGRLWGIALDAFSRVRLFYDEMRRELRTDARYVNWWNQIRSDQDALLQFSTACQANLSDPAVAKQFKPALVGLFKHPHMRDLCQANAIAMHEFGFFLTLPQTDYTKVDSANRYMSGGFMTGDATTNEGHIFGSWYELANLPLKLSALYTLTTPTPYLASSLWPDPYYDSPENRYLYRTLYPREFTKLVSSTVVSNLRFAATGTDNTTSIGDSILAMGSMLPWEEQTGKESERLPNNYNELLNDQDKFQQSLVAVVIEAQPQDTNSKAQANYYKKFTATIYDLFNQQTITASDVYILPRGDVFVRANKMFIYPITKLTFISNTKAYVIAYKVSYDYQEGDQLVEDSVKSALLDENNNIADVCLEGFHNSGLSYYFNNSNPDFQGFHIPPNIAVEVGKEKVGEFYDSVAQAFNTGWTDQSGKHHPGYEEWVQSNHMIPDNFPLQSMQAVCEESLRGIGAISSSAAMLNGYWLGITPQYLER